MVIGLTGGIGCGKSEATRDFATCGFRVIDTDQIVREEVLIDPEVVAAAMARWGKAVVEAGETEGAGAPPMGGLNRARVAEIVFADAEQRKWWEGIIHPRVGAIWRGRVAAVPQADWVVEVPLLFEAGLEKGFDFVVCVGANPSVQTARAIARGLSEAQVCRRIASQLPLAHKLQFAHTVLWNDGSRAFLRAQVTRIAADLRRGC